MIISASGRTDIPAYFSDWFCNRVRAGTVCVRNPYYPEQVMSYRIDSGVVDAVVFCTKNPAPIIDRVQEFAHLRPFFFVTITAYGKDIEPNVPIMDDAVRSLVELSKIAGTRAVCWRYDPIFLDDVYTVDHHIRTFTDLCRSLEGSVSDCVISFIQLYGKTLRNFPGVREVTVEERRTLLSRMVPIAASSGIEIRTCAEYEGTAVDGLGVPGCFTRNVLRRYSGIDAPPVPGGPKREGCKCDLPSRDIGAYNTCLHGCKYCYANYDMNLVRKNFRMHDPDSPLLIGNLSPGDSVVEARQESLRQGQLPLDMFAFDE